MAEFKETMEKLGIDSNIVPSLWETYFIAAQNKYTNKEGNRARYQVLWYKQLNKWLDLDVEEMDALVKAGIKITHNEALYEWSGFIRYLLFDTLIFQEDEKILLELQPKRGMDTSEGMFTLLSYLSGFDQSLKLYKQLKLDDHYLLDIFAVISILMEEYHDLNNEWGTVSTTYIPRLAWGSLHFFDGIAFELARAKFPGSIYKNERSGELIMLADAEQLYDENGQRINVKLEREIKLKSSKDSTIMLGENVIKDGEDLLDYKLNELNVAVMEKISDLPDNIWQSVLYKTDNNNIVANVISADGLAEKAPRVLDENYWEKIYSNDDYILNVFIPSYKDFSIDLICTAATKAWYYFANESEIETLEKELIENQGEEIIKSLLYQDEIGTNGFIEGKNPGTIYPKLFVHESTALSPGLDENFEGNSELRYLYDLFRKYPVAEDRDNTLLTVFGKRVFKDPAIIWQEDNELQKIVKSRLIDDKLLNIAGGFFTPQDLIRLVDIVMDKQEKDRVQAEKKREKAETLAKETEKSNESKKLHAAEDNDRAKNGEDKGFLNLLFDTENLSEMDKKNQSENAIKVDKKSASGNGSQNENLAEDSNISKNII